MWGQTVSAALAALLATALTTFASRPNVVLIVADDLGWNDVGHHGGDIPTPNIDALGQNGLLVDRHYSQPTCSPSRAALLTAKYPSRLGLQGKPLSAGQPAGLPLKENIMPKYFRDLGYTTHLVGKWHLGFSRTAYLPTFRGFDTHFGFWCGYIGHYDGIHFNRGSGLGGLDMHRGTEGAWHEAYGRHITTLLTDEAVAVIRGHGGGNESFLLVLAHAAPHTGNLGLELLSPGAGLDPHRRDLIEDPRRRIYADMVKALDDSVGEVVKALHEQGVLNNTVIAFISDNGAPTTDPLWGYQNHGSNWPLRGEKCSAHEGGVRTVAALWSQELTTRGRLYRNLFHITDWLPTLLSAAGGNPEALGSVDGVDHWKSMLSDGAMPPRTSLLVDMDDSGAEALIDHNWKLIKNYPPDHNMAFSDGYFGASGRGLAPYDAAEVLKSPAGTALGAVRPGAVRLAPRLLDNACSTNKSAPYPAPCYKTHCLYDLATDPCEHLDLALDYPQVVAGMRHTLGVYRSQMVAKAKYRIDRKADPRLWGNYWTPWQDVGSSSVSRLKEGFQCTFRLFVYFSTALLVWANYT